MFLNKKEMAEILGVSIQTIDRWQNLGLPFIKIPGAAPKYEKETVLEWFKSFEKREVAK